MATATTFSILGLLLLGVLVLAPLVIGVLLIVKSRGRDPKHPSCGGCGYDVSGTVGTAARCPECGKDFVVVGILPPGGRRNPIMLWIGIAVMLIPFTCVGAGLILSMVNAQRLAQARQTAVTAQQQAIAAQQAQANESVIFSI